MWIRDRLGRRIYNNDQVYPKCNKEYDVTANHWSNYMSPPFHCKEVEKDDYFFIVRSDIPKAWKDGKCCFVFQFQSSIVEDEQGLVTRIISIHLVLYF